MEGGRNQGKVVEHFLCIQETKLYVKCGRGLKRHSGVPNFSVGKEPSGG